MGQNYEGTDWNFKEDWKQYWARWVTGVWSEVRTGVICGVLLWWDVFVFFAHVK